jgi:hypothetical protein
MTRERLGDFMQVAIAAVISATVACCAMKCHGGHDTPPETIVKTDTVTVVHYDTITAYKPVPFNVYVVDTLYVPVKVESSDTVWVELPREAKVYQDSTYRAVVSGFRPSLDTISVYQRTKVVTVTNNVRIPPPRWSWGVQAGVGLNTGGSVTPYLGVGIQYRLGDFEIRK